MFFDQLLNSQNSRLRILQTVVNLEFVLWWTPKFSNVRFGRSSEPSTSRKGFIILQRFSVSLVLVIFNAKQLFLRVFAFDLEIHLFQRSHLFSESGRFWIISQTHVKYCWFLFSFLWFQIRIFSYDCQHISYSILCLEQL